MSLVRLLQPVLRVALALGLLGVALGLRAQTELDPPGRVGRVAEVQGPVWWFDLAQGQWFEAQRNRPVTAGDRLATGRDARAEVRIGSTTVRLAEGTEVEWLRLDDERVRVQLHRGSLALRLRSREVAAETEFGTDEAWFQPQRGGLYRLDRQDDTTWVGPWRGEVRVMGEVGFEIDTGRRVQLWREGPQHLLRQRAVAPLDDAFAAWVLRDDRADERTASATYVSPEMTGFEDLDRYGRWEPHPEYGSVWFPASVSVDWVPYRQGHWEWIRPWGWTWVDDAPWGFAPFHYGRWVTWRGRWCWVPGSYVARPVYAPALVAWIDGPPVSLGLRIGAPSLSWVALAPWEVFRPHYRVSPGYHDRVNPPDPRRRIPPQPKPGRTVQWANQDAPHAVTTWPSDRFAPPPPQPPLRNGRADELRSPPPPLPPLPPTGRVPGREPELPRAAEPRVQPPLPPLLQPPRAQPQPIQPQPIQPPPMHPQPVQPQPVNPVQPVPQVQPHSQAPMPAPGADDRGPRRRFPEEPARQAPRPDARPEPTPAAPIPVRPGTTPQTPATAGAPAAAAPPGPSTQPAAPLLTRPVPPKAGPANEARPNTPPPPPPAARDKERDKDKDEGRTKVPGRDRQPQP